MSFESDNSKKNKFRMNMSQQQLQYSQLKHNILENNLAQNNNNFNSNTMNNNPNNNFNSSSSLMVEENNNQFIQNFSKTQNDLFNEIDLNIILKQSELKSSIKLLNISINQYRDKQSKITIQITNPLDPLFLYTLELSEIEYQHIKSEQSLLVDFQKFPQFILKMLLLCKNDNEEEKYSCVLNISGAGGNNLNLAAPGILTIEEKTEFRKLNHLMLKLKPANDIILKRYLSNMSKEYKEKYESLLQEYNELYKNFDICQKDKKELEDNYNKLELKYNSSMDNLKNEKNKEINNILEKNLNEANNKLDILEKEKNNKINDLEKKVSILQNTIEELNNTKINLEEKYFKSELDKKDLESKFTEVNTELNIYKS